MNLYIFELVCLFALGFSRKKKFFPLTPLKINVLSSNSAYPLEFQLLLLYPLEFSIDTFNRGVTIALNNSNRRSRILKKVWVLKSTVFLLFPIIVKRTLLYIHFCWNGSYFVLPFLLWKHSHLLYIELFLCSTSMPLVHL